ncbi:hypothetical protein EVAR_57562_1 [Eumeta japonica]|uniref:Helitron helicase-like domain-containing protein n=1 Tax=Eumeta variegata TaxID=151549 RepID=A0A4C2A5H8_EUMVA|nr:hypothetical protein EVAR_57562_1 [Eumeta japonica]
MPRKNAANRKNHIPELWIFCTESIIRIAAAPQQLQKARDDENLDIGRMTTICRYCNALKFKRETAGLCCASGKVKLDPLLTPPQPLKTLFDGTDPDSNHFLQHILEYNNCFMTSFGANIIREGGFMPTCKVNMCEDSMHPPLMMLLQLLAIQLNHETLSFSEEAISCIVNETHRLYDALQYPIIYWQGQDGYDITLKMVDPITEYWTTDDSPINLYRKPTPHARIRSRRYDVRAKLWNSDLFITVTCNPKWTEIERELEPGQNRKIAMT